VYVIKYSQRVLCEYWYAAVHCNIAEERSQLIFCDEKICLQRLDYINMHALITRARYDTRKHAAIVRVQLGVVRRCS